MTLLSINTDDIDQSAKTFDRLAKKIIFEWHKAETISIFIP